LSDNGVFEFTSNPPEALILDAKVVEIGRTASGRPVKISRPPGNYLRFDYGWQLLDSGLNPNGQHSRGHIGVVAAYWV
jgi:hypothetical protein